MLYEQIMKEVKGTKMEGNIIQIGSDGCDIAFYPHSKMWMRTTTATSIVSLIEMVALRKGADLRGTIIIGFSPAAEPMDAEIVLGFNLEAEVQCEELSSDMMALMTLSDIQKILGGIDKKWEASEEGPLFLDPVKQSGICFQGTDTCAVVINSKVEPRDGDLEGLPGKLTIVYTGNKATDRSFLLAITKVIYLVLSAKSPNELMEKDITTIKDGYSGSTTDTYYSYIMGWIDGREEWIQNRVL